MAKQGKVDYSGMGKTDAVRAFLNEHRGEIESRQMGNQDILDGLKVVGVEVSPATLNNVKKEMGLTSQRGPRAAGNGTPRRRTASISAFPSEVDPSVVRHLKALTEETKSVRTAREVAEWYFSLVPEA